MVNARATRERSNRFRRLPAFGAAGVAAAVIAWTLVAGPALAGPKEQPAAEDDHYQVYFGDPPRPSAAEGSSDTLTRDWGSLRVTEPGVLSPAAGLRSPSLTGAPTGTGITYFTPSLSGMRVGIGFTGSPQEGAVDPKSAEYTGLGPRVAPPRDANWQVGGKVGYSGLEIGANVGDHADPTCEAGVACKTNDFWDVGVALRIGSGAISTKYTASQPRTLRPDEVDRIDVFSLNAGYRVHSRLDIYGGVDWVDLHSGSEAAETPVDTRFMLGTNLRF
jgi:hypothetical protein